jgi:hypothetical protein
MTGNFDRAPRSLASKTGWGPEPVSGPFLPTWDVEKKIGLKREKSSSPRNRSIRTEPTIPRHPTMPTLTI